MNKVTKEQYEFALARVEELLPLVDDNTPSNDKNAVARQTLQCRQQRSGTIS